MERSRVITLLLLLVLPAAGVCQSGDIAYVDGPGGRGLYDPARADGGTVSVRAEAAAAPANTSGVPTQQTQMQEMQEMLAAMQAAQQAGAPGAGMTGEGFPGQQPGGSTGGGAYPGGGMTPGYGGDGSDPYGGAGAYGGQQRSMGRGSAGNDVRGQLRSGLLQDVGGLIDAGIERQIYPDGRVISTPPPGTSPQTDFPNGW